MIFIFFFKQKTAYEMRISDWSSDVCSSDLLALRYLLVDVLLGDFTKGVGGLEYGDQLLMLAFCKRVGSSFQLPASIVTAFPRLGQADIGIAAKGQSLLLAHVAVLVSPQFRPVRMHLQIESPLVRSEEHTSDLQSLMRISNAVFCLKKKNTQN